MICLGAGITCTDGVPVETVVDNRNLGENGTQALLRGPGWAHLAGHGGWVVPYGELRTLREDRTGAWADINTTSTTERRTRRWQTLWLDHGTDPTDAVYVYLLMPGARRAGWPPAPPTGHGCPSSPTTPAARRFASPPWV